MTNITIRMPVSLMKNLDASLLLANARSRNEYINKAVQFYNVYLQLNGEPDAFSKIVGDIVEMKMNYVVAKAEANHKQNMERLSRNQFKIATELAKIALIMMDNLNIPPERMEDWHIKAMEEVSTLNGILGFEDRL